MFKDAKNGWITVGLIYELANYNVKHAKFTLDEEDKEIDGVKLKSLRKLFLSFADPTEYAFATTVLGGWTHWEAMKKSEKFQPYYESMRDELDVRLQSIGFQSLYEKAVEGDYNSSKLLLKKEWETKRRAGAPSNNEKKGIRKEMTKQWNKQVSDLEKVRLARKS